MKEWVTLEKSVALGKVGHPCKNGAHLLKSATLGKMAQSSKNGSHF